MTIGTGCAIEFEGTLVSIEANGGSISNNTIVAADDNDYSIQSDGVGATMGYVNLRSVTYSVAPTERTPLLVLARAKDIESGGADEQAPETTYPIKIICAFEVNNVTSAQNFQSKRPVELPRNADYYVWNNGTGQTISSGWILEIIPVAFGPKA